MEGCSSSVQNRPSLPLTGDAHDDYVPLFMQTELSNIKDIDQASPMFLSLVDFVKEGNTLDDNAADKAYDVLSVVMPNYYGRFTVEQILFELVPTHDGSCSGLAKSIVVLLTSSNEILVWSSLSFLHFVFAYAESTHHFAFLQTGFFSLLPQAFYEQELHIFFPQHLPLMKIIQLCMRLINPSEVQQLNQKFQLSEDIIHLTFIDKCFRPIEPFLKAIFRDRRQISDSKDSLHFSDLFVSWAQWRQAEHIGAQLVVRGAEHRRQNKRHDFD
ncbi:hypothetical protein BLNAU_16314 [Blattamonas nauphoetae]|uniref:Uncharacterized protein n=1 Tax=Blattamonas nauphoetae TaxID=2049346 RepID=A0ABQ9XBM1_9EUKA|nr:hypothetical protein BLNAU_16314 [Blattamonas nauphoetae]